MKICRLLYLTISFSLFPISGKSEEARIYTAEVVKVLDGDTVRVFLNLGIDNLYKFVDLRVADIDTPEIFKPLNSEEKERGLRAKAFTEKLCPPRSILKVEVRGTDKYGGRMDAIVYPSGCNKSLGVLLREAGFQK